MNNIPETTSSLHSLKIGLDALRDCLQEIVIGESCHRLGLNRALEALITLDEVWEEVVCEVE